MCLMPSLLPRGWLPSIPLPASPPRTPPSVCTGGWNGHRRGSVPGCPTRAAQELAGCSRGPQSFFGEQGRVGTSQLSSSGEGSLSDPAICLEARLQPVLSPTPPPHPAAPPPACFSPWSRKGEVLRTHLIAFKPSVLLFLKWRIENSSLAFLFVNW